MELTDALKILAARRHFDDLDLALRYVGCVRSEELADTPVPTTFRTDEQVNEPTDNDLAPRSRMDGWSMLPDTELDAAAEDAEHSQNDETARTSHQRRRVRRRRHTAETGTKFVVPFLLEAADQQPSSAPPRYDSVPFPKQHDFGAQASTTALPEIDPRTAESTMYSLLKRPTRSTAIDVDELVRQLALAIPVTNAPRLERNLTRPPMHLLYDTSLLIGPYADDVSNLVAIARGLFDAGVLEIRAFRGTLHGGCGSGPVWTWRSFQVPSRSSTVIIISGSFGTDLLTRVRELGEATSELERKGHHACVLWFGNPPGLSDRSRRSWRVIRT